MRNDQSASEVKIKFKTREGFWHKIDEFPDESKNGRKMSKNISQTQPKSRRYIFERPP